MAGDEPSLLTLRLDREHRQRALSLEAQRRIELAARAQLEAEERRARGT